MREVFTTESFISLIVPEDPTHPPAKKGTTGGAQAEHDAGVWAVPPKEEREIVKLSFK